MEDFDDIYARLVTHIAVLGVEEQGEVRAKYADGEPARTKSYEGVQFTITPDMGVPILKSKFVGSKWAFTELEWIWQEMSNEVSWLHEHGGITIWDEWELSDGTIGKAYGWQLRNKQRETKVFFDLGEEWGVRSGMQTVNQVEYVLHTLKNSPSSRRIMTSLWDVDDLDEMALEPCVWATHWTVQNGKLNLHVKQR